MKVGVAKRKKRIVVNRRRPRFYKENSTHVRVYMSDKRKLELLSKKTRKSIPELIKRLLKSKQRS